MNRLITWHLIAVVSLAALLPTAAFAQSTASAFDGYTPGQYLQGSPNGSIPISGSEVFNPANSQLSIAIPVGSVQGRGAATVPLLVPLTSPIWEAQAVMYKYNCSYAGCQTGWGYILQTSDWNPLPQTIGAAGSMTLRGSGDYCQVSAWHLTLTRLTFTAPDGTQTEFIDQGTHGTPEGQGFNRGTNFVADDGSNTIFKSSTAISDPTGCAQLSGTPSGTMILRNGAQYTINNGSVTQIEDSNGNLTLISSSAITDNLGRTRNISSGSDSTGNYEAISYTGWNNSATRTVKVRYDTLQNHLASGQSLQTFGQLWPQIPGPPTSGGPTNASSVFNPNDIISEIDLPDGSSYKILYDSWADPVQITLPAGGVIQYTYSSSITSTPANATTIYAMSRTITQRTVQLNGTTTAQMKFPGNGEIDRYDGNNNFVAKETHTINNSGTAPAYATNYNSWQYNQSATNTYYDSNGSTVLESQVVNYFQAANCTVNCGTASTVVTTMNPSSSNMVKQSSYSYL